MSEESVPERGGVAEGPAGGLLRRMEELMAALDADLSAFDADLQAAGPGRTGGVAEEHGGAERRGDGRSVCSSGLPLR